ncbi:MAG: MBL fold metallo-hydrolase [Clostridia bacterium]|nr:MBL fold metallo-hydrolase [Clostridia bacterium]
MQIFYGECGPISVNTYFVADETTGRCIVIDPGDADFVREVLKEKELSLEAILLTHGHFDHVMGVKKLKDATGAKIFLHKNDVEMLSAPAAYTAAFPGIVVEPAETDIVLNGGETLELLGASFRVLHTPGHTPGGVCYVLDSEKTVFCGDTIFFGSIGRADFPYSNPMMLIASIKKKIVPLPEDYSLCPGHGGSTNVGYEKAHNPYIGR